jgi:hypothetical protein
MGKVEWGRLPRDRRSFFGENPPYPSPDAKIVYLDPLYQTVAYT